MKLIYIVFAVFAFTITKLNAQKIDFDKRLKELGIELAIPSKPMASYVKAVRTGNLLYLSGHVPVSGFTGKVGRDLTLEQGYEAAKSTGVSMLSTLKAETGDLNKIKHIVKVLGMVNCTEAFTGQYKVINGFQI